ncbi:MAG TPA: hypothetical protein VKG92_00485 [Flavobacteriales bacterium]|nr:hypothetical protein [Flavobacteriales bacterium]
MDKSKPGDVFVTIRSRHAGGYIHLGSEQYRYMFPFRTFVPILLLLTFACAHRADAQSQDTTRATRPVLDAIASNSDSLRALSFEAGPMKFVPFIAPSYTPEMQFLLTAGGLITFAFDRKDKHLLRSSIPFSLGKSTNGSTQLSIKANLYLREDRWRITGEIWSKDMPDNYYGVGYTSAHETPKSDSTTLYHRNWKRIYAKVVHQYKPHFFMGGIYDATGTEATELNPVMAADPSVLAYGITTRNRGLGAVFQFDSRDVPVNAYTGLFLDASVTNYGRFWGGQSEFWVIDLDYRQYKPVGHRHTMAWEVRSRNCRGSVPWTELSQIGTPWDLRGYTWGQYRDELMVYTMGEYRHMFNRKTPNKKGSLESRWGFASWLGLGAVATDIASIPSMLPNAGFGIRFETEKRSNVRVDYGVGTNSSAFYVTFYEAF